MAEPGGAHAAVDDCWNRIGVRGDASCPELKRHAHCRNCPVYSAGAMALLDRDQPPGYVAEWMDYVSRPRSKSTASERQSAVIFRIGVEWFALPTMAFDEVAELRTIHSLPHRRNGTVLGIVNVRGELLICVSLAKLLGCGEADETQPRQGTTARRRLVVIRHASGRMAFPVDEVARAHRYYARELKSVPATVAKAASAYATGILSWRDRTVGCLDAQLIVQALDRSVA